MVLFTRAATSTVSSRYKTLLRKAIGGIGLRLRLRTHGWLGRTWGYAPHHPTQDKLKVAEV